MAPTSSKMRALPSSHFALLRSQAILDNSTSPYAQLLASSSLLKVVTDHALAAPIRLEMRSYFLAYLDGKGPALEPFVVVSIVQLVCRMTKLGWFDDDAFRTIVDDGKVFLEKGTRVRPSA